MNYAENNIVLFDGVCNFCNHTVQFIIKHERKPELRFASLQSATGKRLLHDFNIDEGNYGTFVYVRKGKAYTRSTAALLIALKLRWLWPLLSVFLIIPPFIRNIVYNFIAKNRHKWWGRTDTCQIPSAETRSRFIDI